MWKSSRLTHTFALAPVAVSAVVVALVACSSSSSPTPAPAPAATNPPAPTATGTSTSGTTPPPTFTDVYTQIISVQCAPCHTTSDGIGVQLGHLDMTSQAAAFTDLVNAPAAGESCAGKGTRVVPGQPDMSIMYLKISLDDPSPCGAKMPFGLPPLPADQVDTIKAWITAGAAND